MTQVTNSEHCRNDKVIVAAMVILVLFTMGSAALICLVAKAGMTVTLAIEAIILAGFICFFKTHEWGTMPGLRTDLFYKEYKNHATS